MYLILFCEFSDYTWSKQGSSSKGGYNDDVAIPEETNAHRGTIFHEENYALHIYVYFKGVLFI